MFQLLRPNLAEKLGWRATRRIDPSAPGSTQAGNAA